MTLHKEGTKIILTTIIIVLLINSLTFFFSSFSFINYIVLIITVVMSLLIIQFFRVPKRKVIINDKNILAPADGKVVVIEQTDENEFFKDKRIQVSIFMSPTNVHVNWFPLTGFIKYYKYHKGLFLVAWHPKSSTDNERTTMVIENMLGRQILVRQIAGAVARRIVFYPKVGDRVVQGEQFGFIKFGSRLDLFLPHDSKILVNLEQKVVGSQTVIATF